MWGSVLCLGTFFVVALSDFVIKDSIFGSGNTICTRKQLINTATDEYVSIILEYGGAVDEIVLRSAATKGLKPVILSSNGNCETIAATTQVQGKHLIPYANRIANYTYVWNETRYYLPDNDPNMNNSIHGFLKDLPVTVHGQVAGVNFASVVVGYNFNERQFAPMGYPFNLSVQINYTFSAYGLDINVTATNLNQHWSVPFYNGWHPYFMANVSSAYLILDSCTDWNHVDVNGNLIPTGRTNLSTLFNGAKPIGGTDSNPTFIDDGFKARKVCESKGKERPGFLPAFHTRIKDTVSNDTTVLWHEAERYPIIQAYTGRVPCIAVEPMSGKTNSFNNFDHLKILDGGETWSGTFGVYLE